MTDHNKDRQGNGGSESNAGRLITPEEVIELTGCTMEDLERWARKEGKFPEPTQIGDSTEVGWLPDVVKLVKKLMKKEKRRKKS